MKMKKKGFAGGGMKKGMAKGGKKKGFAGGGMKSVPEGNTGLKKLPSNVRNKMGFMNKGGMPKKKAFAKGGKVAMYNEGGMVRNTGSINTGIKKA